MPSKNITSVTWSCGDLPAGVNFDTATGTFSGTPGEDGEYVVPVTVETNYGTDTKDVKLIVAEPEPEIPEEYGAVYAIGTKAKTWSGNAEADADGFRKLNMPNACRVMRTLSGFAAKTGDGEWYVCGNTPLGSAHPKPYGINSFSPAVPALLPIEDITDISSGYWRATGSSEARYYFAYLTSEHRAGIVRIMSSSSSIMLLDNIKRLSSGYGSGVMTIDSAGAVRYESVDVQGQLASGVSPSQVRKLLARGNYANPRTPTYITKSGNLYEGTERVDFGGGKIRDIWGYPQSDITWHLFAVTEDNQLYAMGKNTYHSLGFSGTELRTELELVGEYDVKTIAQSIQRTFMVTNDGRLYHAGLAVSGVTAAHDEFTQIFPDRSFVDVALYGDNTLVAIVRT